MRGIDTREFEITEIDEVVKNICDSFKGRVLRILQERWLYRKSIADIAKKEKLSESGVQWRVDAIREKVLRYSGLYYD